MSDPDCQSGQPCGFFQGTVGMDSGGSTAQPASVAVDAEVFFVEYVGARVRLWRRGFGGNADTHGNQLQEARPDWGLYQITVEAAGRIPLTPARAQGPLDLRFTLGFHTQNLLVPVYARQSWVVVDANWANGLRLGMGMRFPIVRQLELHASWMGNEAKGGLVGHEAEIGVSVLPVPNLIVDASFLGSWRSVVMYMEDPITATVTETQLQDRSVGFVISGGVVF